MNPIESDPEGQWEEIVKELREYAAQSGRCFGDLDDNTLGRYLAGECDAAEKTRVDEALANHAELRDIVRLVEGVFAEDPAVSSSEVVSSSAIVPGESQLGKNSPTLAKEGKRQRDGGDEKRWAKRHWWVLAASLLLVVGGLGVVTTAWQAARMARVQMASVVDARSSMTEARNAAEQARHLAFSPDGQVLVSSSGDGEIRLWSIDQFGVGQGPGMAGNRHDFIVENPFREAMRFPLSTFSIDVDTASYSKVRNYLTQFNRLPPRGAVRIEELVNYFPYEYDAPEDEHPFAAHLDAADCPWNPRHRLLRIGLKGRVVESAQRPPTNLVFLVDVSGSMNKPNKLPLLVRAVELLTEQLTENDQVSIVVYASAVGVVLDCTRGDQRDVILEALDGLRAGGSTNGGEGIHLAYRLAADHYLQGGVNRVILCTDGDFNVGTTSTDELVNLVEKYAKTGTYLSVLGFGMDNHNDAMLEQISNRGDGNYAFVDTEAEARKVLVEQLNGTLVTIAKDVKIQIEFNPRVVALYRLIGYENRIMASEDFNDDRKDAGDIGAGHCVTALYEIVPQGEPSATLERPVDALRYQTGGSLTEKAQSQEMLTLKLRYKLPDGDVSTLIEFPFCDEGNHFGDMTKDFRFAAAVASFGQLLLKSPYKGNMTYDAVVEMAGEAVGSDTFGYRKEFLSLVKRAQAIAH